MKHNKHNPKQQKDKKESFETMFRRINRKWEKVKREIGLA